MNHIDGNKRWQENNGRVPVSIDAQPRPLERPIMQGDVVEHPLMPGLKLIVLGEAQYAEQDDVDWGKKVVVRFTTGNKSDGTPEFKKKAFYLHELTRIKF